MTRHSIRRAVAVLCAAALTATVAGTALAEDVDPAAKKKRVFRCAGKVATKVGTPGRDVIRGTNKRDVIVALGGHDKIDGRGGHDLICAGPGNDLVIGGTGIDRIYGQAGRDRLFGGPGPDWLAGQAGNDRLNGGLGVDTCHQGPGGGLKVSCERPVAVPAPPPPPPEPKVLAIAYSDLDGSHSPTAGDVLISQLTDTSGDGVPSKGDTVEMGRYPTNLDASTFADWSIKSHVVDHIALLEPNRVFADTLSGARFSWLRTSSADHLYDTFREGFDSTVFSKFQDISDDLGWDSIDTRLGSPSQPPGRLELEGSATTGTTDDRFVDVELYY